MKSISNFRVALAAFALSLPLAAQPLVEAGWLAQNINNRDVVVLHVGEAEGYAKGHLPTARQITLTDLSKPTNADRNLNPQAVMASRELLFELPSTDALRDKLEAVGISNSSRIILYAGTEQPLPAVTRVAHILNYLGLGERTSLLNGGLNAWTKAGHMLTTEVIMPTRGRLTPKVNPTLFADAAAVQTLKPGYKLIDARAAVNYRGIEPTFGKAGHIAGAISIPFTEMNDEAQRFDAKRIGQTFAQAGIKPGDKLIVYCHIGIQATEVIFGARLAGYEAALYDGSFQDWSMNNRGAVEAFK